MFDVPAYNLLCKRIAISMFCVVQFCVVAVALASAQSLPEMRMTIDEIRGSALDNNQIGSSGVAGVHTKVVFGDPAKAGFYTILLFVPAHTTIQAHSHRDQRVASVVSANGISDTAIISMPRRLRRFRREACIRSRPRGPIMRGRMRNPLLSRFVASVRQTHDTSTRPTIRGQNLINSFAIAYSNSHYGIPILLVSI